MSNEFFYIKPGKSKKGVRGDDFLVGEHELLTYLDRLDLGKLVVLVDNLQYLTRRICRQTAYSDAQNHSTSSNDTRKESYSQSAQTPALTEGRDDL
ncbi:uncharacterized protein IUM83_02411 [Phytophthora cinnamomi]|uniref:uncharacterized protein n=1 Tax=Phytophthora cinnamomi TaxID=4785 RepID=UPI00355996C1|nr:hypothetical protein IUM83_02411 [Phytophthora cinnamomi]